MTETRKCEQCGTLFAPRREHARFCSARCRVAWNRQHAGDPPAAVSALGWTITAMRDTIDRLLRARASDQPHGYAAISEAVWWVTMVDATLVRLVLVPSVMQLLGRANWWFPTRSYGQPRGSAAPPARPRRPAGTGSHGFSRW